MDLSVSYKKKGETMRRDLILSNLRIELRRKQANYVAEKSALKWVSKFLEEMSVVHSSQIRLWQRDYFLSSLESNVNRTKGEILQAKSALSFLFNVVLKKSKGIDLTSQSDENDVEPGIMKITG
ncbi:hypothetical protein CWD77_04620 [Rhodohalobacter barkolensis]|uniref:Integrase SAM-like N-terminal domain-containing protein n=2 Tax=Rhodohalobacter barkolensis TaxID=2053187 RepID=A0A2N0VKR3_9BACT|nr:hypothetical protein CWD77_04620 [Rhodohalobacter barkolensis]